MFDDADIAETVIQLPANGWMPRHYQMEAWERFEAGIRRLVLVWHRRAGKDEFALHAAAVSMFERVGTYWHMLPEASQARKAIWQAVNPHTGMRRIDEAFPVELRETTRDNEMFIRMCNGSTWQVVGSDNFNSLVGSPPIGIVFSEYALADPAAWAYLRPILAENGGWAMFISTTRGRNHFFKLYSMAVDMPELWFAQLLKASETKAIPAKVLESERRELIAERGAEEGEAMFDQEYECSWDAALPGAYYGRAMQLADKEARVGLFPHIKGVPVITAWDLGIGDSTAIWFAQRVPPAQSGGRKRLRLIDYVEGSGVGMDWYARQILVRGQKFGYEYGEHLLPHDAAARVQEQDVRGRTRKEMLESAGVRNLRVLPVAPVDDGIAAVRRLFPQLEFNTHGLPFDDEDQALADARLQRGQDTIRNYHRAWDDKNKKFSDQPKHDWTSHGADAARTLAMGLLDTNEGQIKFDKWKLWKPVKEGQKPEPPPCIQVLVSVVAEPQRHGVEWTWMRWGIFEDEQRGRHFRLPAAIVLERRIGTGLDELATSLDKLRKAGDRFLLYRDRELTAVRRELVRRGIVLQPIEIVGVEAAIEVAGEALAEGRVYAPDLPWARDMRMQLDRYPAGDSQQLAIAFAQVMNYIRHLGLLDEQEPEKPKRKTGAKYA